MAIPPSTKLLGIFAINVMKIMMIGYYLIPEYVEAIKKSVFIISESLSYKHEIIFITPGAKDKIINYNGIKIYTIGVPGFGFYNFLKSIPHFIKKSREIIKNERPDIIHDHFGLYGSSMITNRIVRDSHIPLIKTVYTHPVKVRDIRLFFQNPGINKTVQEYIPNFLLNNKTLFSKVTKNFNSLIYQTNTLRYELKSNPDVRSCYIPNGIDYKEFSTAKKVYKEEIKEFIQYNQIEESTKNIFYLGHFSAQKGIDYIIKAMPTVIKEIKNVKFIFAWSGKGEFDYYYEKIKKKNLDKYTIFLGKVDPKIAFAPMDLFILPLVCPWGTISSPSTILESMASGTSVISTRVGSIPEILKGRGFLIPPLDSRKLSESIIYALTNEKETKKLRIKAKYFASNFGWKKITKELEKVYIKNEK